MKTTEIEITRTTQLIAFVNNYSHCKFNNIQIKIIGKYLFLLLLNQCKSLSSDYIRHFLDKYLMQSLSQINHQPTKDQIFLSIEELKSTLGYKNEIVGEKVYHFIIEDLKKCFIK